MTKIILHGCMGGLGTAIRNLSERDAFCKIVHGITRGGNVLPFPTSADINQFNSQADVVVDCSVVEAIPALLDFGVARGIPLVICTTGLPPALMEDVHKASEKVAILQSANMSLGINLLVNMVARAAPLLAGAGFDVEIIEKHHNKKVDAPSGTALALANSVNEALGNTMEYTYDRSQERKKREAKELGIHAIRGGTIVGEHSVIFAGSDEVIEFKHQATSKEVFAVGALKAACFIKGKAPGFYTMQDLINN